MMSIREMKRKTTESLMKRGHARITLKRRRGSRKTWTGRCKKCNFQAAVSRENGRAHVRGLPSPCPGKRLRGSGAA